MPNVYVDLEVDDFIWSCSTSEKEALVQHLKEEGFITPDDVSDSKRYNKIDEDWVLAVQRLLPNRFRLTTEEENFIIEISKKFI